jgi:oligopeptide/dipeptide ABC transporter ATP-binding protein
MTRGRSEKVLRIDDLVVEFATRGGQVRAVDHVSLEIGYGERLGIVGESGSGKSALARTAMGLTRDREAVVRGSVELAGQQVLSLGERQRRALWGRTVAMVFQDPLSSLHPITPVGDQIAEAVRRDPGVTRRAADRRAVELLETVGIQQAARRATQRAFELSGGMRQRVAIAMAIACRPQLIIADEPTTALDVTVQARILELFDRLCDEFDISLILVSHDLGVVAQHTDAVAVMYAGRIGEYGPAADVFARPAMRYTGALMAAMPRMTAEQTLPKAIPGLPPVLVDPPPGCRFAPRCGFGDQDCRDRAPQLVGFRDRPEHRYACWHPAFAENAAGPAEQLGVRR